MGMAGMVAYTAVLFGTPFLIEGGIAAWGFGQGAGLSVSGLSTTAWLTGQHLGAGVATYAGGSALARGLVTMGGIVEEADSVANGEPLGLPDIPDVTRFGRLPSRPRFKSVGAMAKTPRAPRRRSWTPSESLSVETVRAGPKPARVAAGGGVDDALLPNLSRAEIDAAFTNRNLGPLVEAPAAGVSGSGPKTGSTGIWFHDNLRVRGVQGSPGGRPVNVRVHSENPAHPAGYTLQVNTHITNPSTQGASRYMTQEGTWHLLDPVDQALMRRLHIPAGN
jgi:hypothetical protein